MDFYQPGRSSPGHSGAGPEVDSEMIPRQHQRDAGQLVTVVFPPSRFGIDASLKVNVIEISEK